MYRKAKIDGTKKTVGLCGHGYERVGVEEGDRWVEVESIWFEEDNKWIWGTEHEHEETKAWAIEIEIMLPMFVEIEQDPKRAYAEHDKE